MSNHYSAIDELRHLIADCRGTTFFEWLKTAATFACVIAMGISFCVIAEMLKP